jgi:predicted translin family RNA/ssDNA-binding protein
MSRTLAKHGELFYGGFVHNGQKEYAEACITLALVAGETLPDPDELGVSYAAYLNGLGEAAGEMRRHLLDTLREGKIERCEEILWAMDDIYSLLVTIDFHDAMTGGFLDGDLAQGSVRSLDSRGTLDSGRNRKVASSASTRRPWASCHRFHKREYAAASAGLSANRRSCRNQRRADGFMRSTSTA